uniref:(northern house mosquito) hypothetical protein n=1 Tax=Culex pipiens TaxID=7175 RepID=A0A8D7ZVV6_CULPI
MLSLLGAAACVAATWEWLESTILSPISANLASVPSWIDRIGRMFGGSRFRNSIFMRFSSTLSPDARSCILASRCVGFMSPKSHAFNSFSSFSCADISKRLKSLALMASYLPFTGGSATMSETWRKTV